MVKWPEQDERKGGPSPVSTTFLLQLELGYCIKHSRAQVSPISPTQLHGEKLLSSKPRAVLNTDVVLIWWQSQKCKRKKGKKKYLNTAGTNLSWVFSLPPAGWDQQPVLLRAVYSPATPANCLHLSLPTLQSVPDLLCNMNRGEMELEADTEWPRVVWNSRCCGFVTKAGNLTGEMQMDSRGLINSSHTARSSGSRSGLELFGNHFTSLKSHTRWRWLQKFTDNTWEKVIFHKSSHLQGGTAAPWVSFLQTIIQLEPVPDLIERIFASISGGQFHNGQSKTVLLAFSLHPTGSV